MSVQEADENGSDGLDIDEFKAAFGQILGKGKKDQQVSHSQYLQRRSLDSVCSDGSDVYEDRYKL